MDLKSPVGATSTVLFNCPHAAKMSRPRGRRTNVGIPAATKIRWNANTRSCSGVRYGNSVPGFSAIKLIFALMPRTNSTTFARLLRSVIHVRQQHILKCEPLSRPQRKLPRRFHQFPRFHFRFSGITSLRNASFDPFSEIASFGRSGSCPKS